jgi:S-formylglutathione hydrolase FrmB
MGSFTLTESSGLYDVYTHASDIMNRNMINVIIKPDKPSEKQSKLFFYLPGAFLSGEENVLTKDQVINHAKGNFNIFKKYANAYNMYIVCVQGDSYGMYTDWANPMFHNNYETYHTSELYDTILNTFPVSKCRVDIGLFGISMGGYGVMNYFTKHPNKYSYLGTFSGLIGTELFPLFLKSVARITKTVKTSQTKRLAYLIESIFGNMNLFIKSSPMDKFGTTNPGANFLFFSVGNGVQGLEAVKENSGSLSLERMVRLVNIKFYNQVILKNMRDKQDYCFIDRTGGHTWYYWGNEINFFFKTLKGVLDPGYSKKPVENK